MLSRCISSIHTNKLVAKIMYAIDYLHDFTDKEPIKEKATKPILGVGQERKTSEEMQERCLL